MTTDFQRRMPCGFIRTDSLYKNLTHYSLCPDPACRERAEQWEQTIKKHSSTRARELKVPVKLPTKRALDSRHSSCSSIGHKPSATRQAPNRTAKHTGASESTQHMAKQKTKKAAKAAAKGKAASKKAAVNTGYVALIRSLLMGQKHSVADAAAAVLKKFPGKELRSIKRIAFNVAKRARLNADTKNIRWLPSARTNTGYMARIDELLHSGDYTTRQIGEMVSKEFKGADGKPKSVVSAKKVVRARYKRLRDAGKMGKVRPLSEAELKARTKKAEKPAKGGKGKPAVKSAKPAKVKAAKKAKKAKKTAPVSENGAPLVEVPA